MTRFVEGEVYYQLKYPDPNLAYPLIESIVFIGKNISDEDLEDTWYFQLAESYAKFGSVIETKQGDRKVYGFIQGELSDVLDFNGLVNELENAASRRLRVQQGVKCLE